MKITPSKHCDLCEHEIASLKNGVTCKLTKRKPDFKNTCSTITLDTKFQEKLERLNIDLEGVKRNKNNIYWKFYIQILLGFIFVAISIGFMYDYFGAIHYYFAYLMITAGFTLWTSAVVTLSNYRKERKTLEFNKNRIDQVLKRYGIDYTSNIIIKDKTHGILELDIELKYTNWIKKSTTTSYKISG